MPTYERIICIVLFTDKTLAVMESFPNLIIIFYSRGSEWWRKMLYIYIYIYIYVWVIFGLVKKFGVIPSGQENHSRAEHLNFPGRELNVIYYRAIFL